MRKFKCFLILFGVLSVVSIQNHVLAQDSASVDAPYKSSIGLRLGYPLSLSYKTFISEKGAVEIYAGYRGFTGYNWFSLSGAYLSHSAISDVEGLSWYWGAGGTAYFFSWDNELLNDGTTTSFGANGYLGLEYKIKNAPLSLSLDWVPTYFISGFGSGFGGSYGGLGVRYVLK